MTSFPFHEPIDGASQFDLRSTHADQVRSRPVPYSVAVNSVVGDTYVNCGYAIQFGNYWSAYINFINYGSGSNCSSLFLGLSSSTGSNSQGGIVPPNKSWVSLTRAGTYASAQYIVKSSSATNGYNFKYDSGGTRVLNQSP